MAESSGAPPDLPRWARLHLWQIAALRDVSLVAILIGGLWALFALRAVTGPVAVALVLASVFHPVATYAERRLGWPRVLTTAFAVLVLVAGGVLFAVFGVPLLVQSVRDVVEDLPRYTNALIEGLGLDPAVIRERLDLDRIASLDTAQSLAGRLLGFLGLAADVLGIVVYLLIAGVFGTVTFAWAVVHFDDLPSIRRYLPASRRDQIWEMLWRFGEVFAGFVRGQVLVAMFTTIGFAIGFTALGVPHGLVAALVGGVLSFVPNGQASGWLLAMAFSAIDVPPDGEFSWLTVVVWPSCVYAVTQSLETFVVTPLVQGQATRMHPLAVLGAVIAGGAIGGLLGILLAIPLAACAWIAVRELVAPAVQALADER